MRADNKEEDWREWRRPKPV